MLFPIAGVSHSSSPPDAHVLDCETPFVFLRQDGTICRLAGDEFVIIAEGIGGAADLEPAIDCITHAFEAPAVIESRSVEVSASIGAAMFPDDGQDATTLLDRADRAMYAAKSQKGTAHRFHSVQ